MSLESTNDALYRIVEGVEIGDRSEAERWALQLGEMLAKGQPLPNIVTRMTLGATKFTDRQVGFLVKQKPDNQPGEPKADRKRRQPRR